MSRQRIFLYVAAAAAVNCLAINFLLASAGAIGDVAFNLLRLVIAFAGGWLLVANAGAPLRIAALAGVLVLVVDHILLKGGWFLAGELLFPSAGEREGYLAFGGVIISFFMFAPVAALCSWFGDLVARRAS